ncbi:MAG: hypothetical protein R2749_15690 [Acidimicrobiales bacterium]
MTHADPYFKEVVDITRLPLPTTTTTAPPPVATTAPGAAPTTTKVG